MLDGPAIVVALALLFWTSLLVGRGALRWPSLAVTAGGLALLVAAGLALHGSDLSLALAPPWSFGMAPPAFRLDPLAAWFLAVIGLVAAAIGPYLPGYLAHLAAPTLPKTFWPALGLLLVSMAAVVLAANTLTFLVAWEVMSLSSFVLVATAPRKVSQQQAALTYLGATRLGTAMLMGGFLWAHALTHSWAFADWRLSGVEALGPGLLILLGLGVKAGMWPFHSWLPMAHPVAPSPVSALMSGVMVKVAVYAMIRFFVVPHAFVAPGLGVTVLAFGAASAFWGVLLALLQHDLKRLLAYHTVENVGLILMGVGGAIVARDLGLETIARVALAAALYHTINHAAFKSLLFLSAGAVDFAVGTRDLEHLGGLGARMPVTFACFVLGSAAICALPPFNGFASEWLLYQSIIGLAGSLAPPLVRFLAMLLLGWIAMIGALALACFIKATGVAFLGRPRSAAAGEAVEVPLGMRTAQVSLAIACILLGALAPAVLSVLHGVTASLEPLGAPLAAAWTLPFGALLPVMLLTIAAGGLGLAAAARTSPVRIYHTWECGFGDLGPRMQVTASSFAQPLLRLFGPLLRYAITREIEGDRGDLFPRRMVVEPTSEAVLEERIYQPLLRRVDRLSAGLVRLQAGSIHAYLLTMLLALLALLGLARMVP